MEFPITLWLTEAQVDAITASAKPYGRTPEAQVLTWIASSLAEAEKLHVERRWEARKRVLDADPVLAETIDDAVPKPATVTR